LLIRKHAIELIHWYMRTGLLYINIIQNHEKFESFKHPKCKIWIQCHRAGHVGSQNFVLVPGRARKSDPRPTVTHRPSTLFAVSEILSSFRTAVWPPSDCRHGRRSRGDEGDISPQCWPRGWSMFHPPMFWQIRAEFTIEVQNHDQIEPRFYWTTPCQRHILPWRRPIESRFIVIVVLNFVGEYGPKTAQRRRFDWT